MHVIRQSRRISFAALGRLVLVRRHFEGIASVMKQAGLAVGYAGLALLVGGLLYFRTLAVSTSSIGWSLAAAALGLLLTLVAILIRRVTQGRAGGG